MSQAVELETTVLLDGLTFPESPRWDDGKLWFVDIPTRRVMTVDLDGNAETVVEVPDQPGGLGWLPDGRLLVVSMRDRRLLRLDPGGPNCTGSAFSPWVPRCDAPAVGA